MFNNLQPGRLIVCRSENHFTAHGIKTGTMLGCLKMRVPLQESLCVHGVEAGVV